MADAIDITFPKFADTLVEGTIAGWIKRAGDTVTAGEPIVEVETDKVNATIDAPFDGVLLETLAATGETVQVGQIIARMDTSGSMSSEADRASDTHAHELPDSAPEGLSRMRRLIAEKMQEARASIPQGACVRLLDVSAIDRHGVSWTVLFVHALAIAADASAVGIAVDVPEGIMVPVVKNANTLSVDELSATIVELVQRARDGTLRPEDTSGAHWTMTNLGTVGTLMGFPIVTPGQDGVLAAGTIQDGRCYLTLGFDRRAIDDYSADRLLYRVATSLEVEALSNSGGGAVRTRDPNDV